MRFREFFLSELNANFYSPRVTRIVGIYDLPDLGAATQLGQTPVGGYQNVSHLAQWKATQMRYNQRYPLELHNVDSSKVDKEVSSLSYEQMKAAMIDLASRIQSIGSVLASAGTHPGDRDMSSRTRDAHFEGQKHGVDINNQIVRGDAAEPGVNVNIIRNVDGRAFYGEVSGRGGTQGFKAGEALRVIVPSNHGQQCPDCGKPHEPSHFDLFVDQLRTEMGRAIQIFSQFERRLQAMVTVGGWGDQIIQRLGSSKGVPAVPGMQAIPGGGS